MTVCVREPAELVFIEQLPGLQRSTKKEPANGPILSLVVRDKPLSSKSNIFSDLFLRLMACLERAP
jgi:hypothetical protein